MNRDSKHVSKSNDGQAAINETHYILLSLRSLIYICSSEYQHWQNQDQMPAADGHNNTNDNNKEAARADCHKSKFCEHGRRTQYI